MNARLRKGGPVLVTGGAGYVGSALVPKLLASGHDVRVLDLYLYGRSLPDHPRLRQTTGDIRDRALLKRVLEGCDAVIHLACISNDPSFELDPALGKSINYDAFPALVDIARDSGVSRFIYASSSSVYGVKKDEHVTEDLPLEPLTSYSTFKAMCEEILLKQRQPGFETLILRSATVCGYAPRLRLDLTVNMLTAQALCSRHISVFGGHQVRPHIHIDDITDVYVRALDWPSDKVDGAVYNVGCHNRRVTEIAESVRAVVGEDVQIETLPITDRRSYHISSSKIARELGFTPHRDVRDAVQDLVQAFHAGKMPDPMTDDRYYNIRRMQRLMLT